MGILDSVKKLINPGAVSQPPPSKTPEVAVPGSSPGTQEGVGASTKPQENAPVAETVAPLTPEAAEPAPITPEAATPTAPETQTPTVPAPEMESPRSPLEGEGQSYATSSTSESELRSQASEPEVKT